MKSDTTSTKFRNRKWFTGKPVGNPDFIDKRFRRTIFKSEIIYAFLSSAIEQHRIDLEALRRAVVTSGEWEPIGRYFRSDRVYVRLLDGVFELEDVHSLRLLSMMLSSDDFTRVDRGIVVRVWNLAGYNDECVFLRVGPSGTPFEPLVGSCRLLRAVRNPLG